MRRVLLSALLISALQLPAGADPLRITPDSYGTDESVAAAGPPDNLATAPPAPAPSPRQRYADAGGANLGGGFIEFLFGGAARPAAVQRPYQPAAAGYQQSAPQPYASRDEPALQAYVPAPPSAAPDNTAAIPMFGDAGHPAIDPKYDRQLVDYASDEAPGTVVIDTPHKFLYLVEGNGKAMRYGIGVGRPGFTWAGVKTITAKKEWPDWIPPQEMIERRPDLPRYMAGGPENPLGARAMYLGSTLYRIHGSNEPWTIGQQVSSGCIRMRNDDVTDLYNRVKVGTRVVVI
jgi:lipoprotein-anchoring transpeptidase ErfK/SrfK